MLSVLSYILILKLLNPFLLLKRPKQLGFHRRNAFAAPPDACCPNVGTHAATK